MKKTLFISTLALSLGAFAHLSLANEHGANLATPWTLPQWNATQSAMPLGDALKGEKLHRDAMCMTCHGAHGIAPSRNVPNLADNTPEYTFKMLLDYQSGLRHEGDGKSAVMQAAAHALSQQDMADLAVYYAQQTLPKTDAAKPTEFAKVDRLVRKGDASRMITPCASCHGAHGEGNEVTPALAGQTPHYFIRTMHAYKAGHRTNDIHEGMGQFTHDLTDAEITALADYYAALDSGKGK
ncbi:c-type cytochrome [Thiosulfativibrio zosterae]|uniref:Cytochrome c domain-containing protein n=1 Tax=Thiosulfativibrio zosterae TaxID=2675053 RepID=A0A6F8PLV8_9GAMM|nr:c-type cytochrome [Thiosulfativibrio zosterae]BBP42980.1 hypothetical protein THMIRHAT_07260 [Thiosulfativibrio zosterae]